MLYKITDKYSKTRDCQWGENVTHKAKSRGRSLCTSEVIHAYKDPYLAVFHNPIGGDYDTKTMLMWEAKGRIVANDGMKVGCKSLTTVRRIKVPKISTTQRVEIAIRCAAEAAWAARAAAEAARAARAAAGGNIDIVKIIHSTLGVK